MELCWRISGSQKTIPAVEIIHPKQLAAARADWKARRLRRGHHYSCLAWLPKRKSSTGWWGWWTFTSIRVQLAASTIITNNNHRGGRRRRRFPILLLLLFRQHGVSLYVNQVFGKPSPSFFNWTPSYMLFTELLSWSTNSTLWWDPEQSSTASVWLHWIWKYAGAGACIFHGLFGRKTFLYIIYTSTLLELSYIYLYGIGKKRKNSYYYIYKNFFFYILMDYNNIISGAAAVCAS